ncbi:MAG: Mini-ribonuclease 3 [Clostridia bacterium]|nr:Mini-ribonuclease 3 [Clostridia bacterium]
MDSCNLNADKCAENSLYETVKQSFSEADKKDPAQIAPLTLAYIGDTVYDLYVRSYLISTSSFPVNRLHVMSTKLVCSSSQADSFHRIEDMLTEQELAVFKRGRNTHSAVPKNSDCVKYRIATGLEALLGFLYLSGDDDRLSQIMQKILIEGGQIQCPKEN